MSSSIVSRLARRYRKEFPLLKFRIRRAKLEGAFATAHLDMACGTCVLTFPPDMDQPTVAFLMAHELAHCMAMHEGVEHGPAFWDAYKRTYAIYEAFCAE